MNHISDEQLDDTVIVLGATIVIGLLIVAGYVHIFVGEWV